MAETVIKIFAACHKDCTLPDVDFLVPVQAGRAVSAKLIQSFIGDDTGDNVSEKNREYCELTVQYWAWKNAEADYYGFCHYRRFICFNANSKKPYILLNEESAAESIGSCTNIVNSYDIVTTIPEEMYVSVRSHYGSSKNHYATDLELAEEILYEQHPEFKSAAKKYLNGTKHFFCNMYIMKKDLFVAYCAWLFPILEEFDHRKTKHGDFQADRADGFIAERLFGVYYTKLCENVNIKRLEVPRGDISDKSRLVYKLLPPSSRRRHFIKKLLRK